jgi:hypothetical protein
VPPIALATVQLSSVVESADELPTVAISTTIEITLETLRLPIDRSYSQTAREPQ